MLPQSTVALRVSRHYSKVPYGTWNSWNPKLFIFLLKVQDNHKTTTLFNKHPYISSIGCVMECISLCGILFWCTLSVSAFIEPSLHQLDLFLEIFLWRFAFMCGLTAFTCMVYHWANMYCSAVKTILTYSHYRGLIITVTICWGYITHALLSHTQYVLVFICNIV